MLLRALREPGTGAPSPLARMLAVLVVVGLLSMSLAVLAPVFRWLAQLF